MVDSVPPDYDFSAWAKLAASDPAGFEAARTEAIERVIAGGVNRDALRGLQWKLDAERQRSRAALKNCLRASSLMWDAALALQAKLDGLVDLCDTGRATNNATPTPLPLAKVLPFSRPVSPSALNDAAAATRHPPF